MAIPTISYGRFQYWEMKRRKALVLVDLQTEFAAAKDITLITKVCDLIKDAISNNRYIFLLEYRSHGPTLSPLKKLLKRYPKLEIVKKFNDSGAVACRCRPHSKPNFSWARRAGIEVA
jgi:nicotinamidase-related amidase